MPSANLCFSVPLFKKQIKRFWPLFSLYSFLLLMLLPVYLLLMHSNRSLAASSDVLKLDFHDYLLNITAHTAPWIALVFGILVAMALWSYLYNHRAVSMMHALPLSRGSLFLTNYLCGLAFTLVPNLIIFLLTLCVEAVAGAVTMQALLIWLMCQSLLSFFFFSFATMLAFVTGHILVLPCLFGIFNGMTKAVSTMVDWLFGTFIFGYASGSLTALNHFGDWFSPMVAIVRGLRIYSASSSYADEASRQAMQIRGLSVVAIFAAVGVVMTVLAYLLYRRRRLELSGEVIVVGFLQPVFKYGVAVCAGLCFGTLFFEVFQEVFSRGIGTLLSCLLLWAVIGYFAAEMLLKKSFRVIRKSLPGAVVLLMLMTAGVLAMEWDLGGYERNIPQADQVSSVIVVGNGGESFDPEIIKATIAMQESIVQEKREIERQDLEYEHMMRDMVDSTPYLETLDWNFVSLEYKLKNGDSFQREYRIPISAELLSRENSPATLYGALINRPDWTLTSYFPKQLRAEELLQVEVQTTQTSKAKAGAGRALSYEQKRFSGEEAQLICAAVREDMAAGRLGHDYLLQNEEAAQINYVNSIYFSFRGAYNTEEPSAGQWYQKENRERKDLVEYEVSLNLQKTATATLAVLEKLGLRQGVELMSEHDAAQIDDTGKFADGKHVIYPGETAYADTVMVP